MNIPGMGPDAPVEVTADGGRQSRLGHAFHLFPPLASAAAAAVQDAGRIKYGEWNWLDISVEDNLNHAQGHITAALAGDTQEGGADEHLAHALCRVAYALELTLVAKAAGQPWRSSYDIAVSRLVKRLTRAGEPRKEET